MIHMSRPVWAVYLMFVLSWLNSGWWSRCGAGVHGVIHWHWIIEHTLDVAFQGVLVATLSLCLSLDGVVYPRAQAGFGPASVRNALNAPSNGWNCANMCLIIQSSWMWNESGWDNQAAEEVPPLRFTKICSCSLWPWLLGMNWRSGRVLLGFLPPWHARGSDHPLHICHHWGTGCNSVFCSQSCEILLPTIPTNSVGNSSAFMVFPFRNE